MKLFDSHIHLNHEAFDRDRDEVWERAMTAGVARAVVVGWDLESSRKAVELAERHPQLTVAVGVSPHDVARAPEDYIDRLKVLANHPAVAAIGEIGLEYFHPVGPKEVQRRVLAEQLRLANDLGLPVVIHNRDADADLLEELTRNRPCGGVLHCFTSTIETMNAALALGFYISLPGIVTFKNEGGLGDVVRAIPEDRLLIETDCPYLAPVPFRGKRCEPSMVEKTLLAVAAARGVDAGELAEITFQNAERLFR